jgi:hypothetical protein
VYYRQNLRWTRSYIKAIRLWIRNKGGRISLVININKDSHFASYSLISNVEKLVGKQSYLTFIPACRKNLRAGKNNRYFHFKHLRIHAHLDTPYNVLKLYSVATSGHLKPLLLEYHVVIIALTPDLQRVFFHSVTEFLHHSSTTELILPLILNQRVLSELSGLITMQEIVISLVAAMACKFR